MRSNCENWLGYIAGKQVSPVDSHAQWFFGVFGQRKGYFHLLLLSSPMILVQYTETLKLCQEYGLSCALPHRKVTQSGSPFVCVHLLPVNTCPFRCRLSGTGAVCGCARACGHCWSREHRFPSALPFGCDWGLSWKAGGWLACFARWTPWSRWIAWGVLRRSGWCKAWLDTSEIPELLNSKPCLRIYSTSLQGTEVTRLEDMSFIKRPVPGGLGVISRINTCNLLASYMAWDLFFLADDFSSAA